MPPFVLRVPDAIRASEFYARAFGAKELGRNCPPDGGWVVQVSLPVPGGGLLLADGATAQRNGATVPIRALTFDAGGIEDAWSRATEAGARIQEPLQARSGGGVCGVLSDPFGHLWAIQTLSEPTPARGPSTTSDDVHLR